MAGTVSLNKIIKAGRKIHQIVCDWRVPTGSGTTIALGAGLLSSLRYNKAEISGKILSVQTIPGVQGDRATEIPTNLYDMTLNDNYGYDVLDGNIANRASTVAEMVVFSTPIEVNSELTLAVTNTATPTSGRLILYVDPSSS